MPIKDAFNCAEQSAMLNQLNAHKTQNPQERHLIEGGENVRVILLYYYFGALHSHSILLFVIHAPNEHDEQCRLSIQ